MKIGEISKMLGISIETIRFYEKEGIVKPTRDNDSGYRDYEMWDLFYLIDCMEYRNIGMSVKEISQFIQCGTIDDLLAYIKSKKLSLNRQIIEAKSLLGFLEDYESKLRILPMNVGNYWIVERPEISYVPSTVREGQNYRKNTEYDGLSEWISKRPYVDSTQLIDVSEMESDQELDRDIWAASIPTENMAILGLREDEYVKKLPRSICMTTVLDIGDRGTLSLNRYRDVLEKVREKGYIPTGTITSNLIVRCWKDGGYYRLAEVKIPLKK